MICNNCTEDMQSLGGFDTGSNGNKSGKGKNDEKYSDIAFNIHLCGGCGSICKENVWTDKGNTWIYDNGEVLVKM